MVLIKGGWFYQGSDPDKEPVVPRITSAEYIPYADESPRHKVRVSDFYLDRREVTFNEFREFLEATGYPTPGRWGKVDYAVWGKLPVKAVSWYDANSYALWRGKRLPTEAEWEYAARGGDGRRFPWGNKPLTGEQLKSADRLRLKGKRVSFDASPFGLEDMGGSVSEWTNSWYKAYPGNQYSNKDYGEKFKVFRGGAWGEVEHYRLPYFFRCAFRNRDRPSGSMPDIGFRCARSVFNIRK